MTPPGNPPLGNSQQHEALRRPVMRLAGKIAVIVGAGQSPGEGIGNGRATVLRFVQEGARVLAVDRDLAAAEETAGVGTEGGGGGIPFQGDGRRGGAPAARMAGGGGPWG